MNEMKTLMLFELTPIEFRKPPIEKHKFKSEKTLIDFGIFVYYKFG